MKKITKKNLLFNKFNLVLIIYLELNQMINQQMFWVPGNLALVPYLNSLIAVYFANQPAMCFPLAQCV